MYDLCTNLDKDILAPRTANATRGDTDVVVAKVRERRAVSLTWNNTISR
jgi:hypothetical protein